MASPISGFSERAPLATRSRSRVMERDHIGCIGGGHQFLNVVRPCLPSLPLLGTPIMALINRTGAHSRLTADPVLTRLDHFPTEAKPLHSGCHSSAEVVHAEGSHGFRLLLG